MGWPSSPLLLIWSTVCQWSTSQWHSSLGFWPQNRLSTQWQECLGWSYFASFGVLLLPKGPHLAGKPRCSMFRGWCGRHRKEFSYYNILVSWPPDSSILFYQMCWKTKPNPVLPNQTKLYSTSGRCSLGFLAIWQFNAPVIPKTPPRRFSQIFSSQFDDYSLQFGEFEFETTPPQIILYSCEIVLNSSKFLQQCNVISNGSWKIISILSPFLVDLRIGASSLVNILQYLILLPFNFYLVYFICIWCDQSWMIWWLFTFEVGNLLTTCTSL